MKAILLAFTVIAASVITLEAAAGPCTSPNCATDEPIVSTPPQDGCSGSGCAVPDETVQPA